MEKEKKTEIKVGITVLLSLLIFLFIYGWAKNFSLSSEEKILKINFPTAAGLEIGDMVSVNGVKKGLVESITSTSNYAHVSIKFRENVDIREDAIFSIMMLDLMGGKKVEISSGLSANELDYSKTHPGNFAGDISTAMATLSSVETDLVDVISELKISLQGANNIINNPDFSNNITETLEEFKILSQNMNQFLSDNKEIVSETIKNTKEITSKTNLLLDKNSDNLTSVIKNLDSTITSSNSLIKKLTKLSSEVSNSENNLGKILYNEELFNDLKVSIKQLKELTKTINDQLNSGGLEVKADVDLF